MFDIPSSFKNESEGYIIIPAMKHFLKKHNLKTHEDREENISAIIAYANESSVNEEVVLCWVNSVIREGSKEAHVKHIRIPKEAQLLFDSDNKVEAFITPLESNSTKHVSTFIYQPDYSYIRHELYTNMLGKCLSIYLGRNLNCLNKDFSSRRVPYVVVVEVYPEISFVIGRAKSKSNLYDFDGSPFSQTKDKATTAEIQIEIAVKKIINLFACTVLNKNDNATFFENNLYTILDKYTQTPIEIKKILNDKHEQLVNLVDQMKQEFCLDPNRNYTDVHDDLTNLAEKYLSIYWPDEKVFTRGRQAFPIRLSATDEEESRVDQKSGGLQPLQSKAIFFDNKRMLVKNRTCDSAHFCYNRMNPKYFNPLFQVKFTIHHTKDYATIKFPDYTQEEDIQNVLLEIIKPEFNPSFESDPTT